jgi:hypothetical protein
MCSGIQEVVSYICAGFYLKDWRTILYVYMGAICTNKNLKFNLVYQQNKSG